MFDWGFKVIPVGKSGEEFYICLISNKMPSICVTRIYSSFNNLAEIIRRYMKMLDAMDTEIFANFDLRYRISNS